MDKNKVKFNLKNAHYAVLEEDASGTQQYAAPVPIPGSVSLSLDAQGDIYKFYADGVVYYQSASNNGYDGELEIALIPDSFRQDVLGEVLDSNKVLVETLSAVQKPFALLFEFDGDKKSTRHVLYNCTATRPSIESKTTEESKEVMTDKLSLSCTANSSGNVKASTLADTDSNTYENWFNKVYQKDSAAAQG